MENINPVDLLNLGVVGIMFFMWWNERRDGAEWKEAFNKVASMTQEKQENIAAIRAMNEQQLIMLKEVTSSLRDNTNAIVVLTQAVRERETAHATRVGEG
jgi:hypothetical protein